MRPPVCAALLLVLAVLPAGAQQVTPTGSPSQPRVGADSTRRTDAEAAYERARALVVAGQAAAGRQVTDSLVTAAQPGSDAYATALYWRATLAPTAADAERDYRRIIVEYPLSARTADALLALAQLEMTRNDRPAAIGHLQRFLLEYPERAERTRAGIWLGRLLMDNGDMVRGCAQLGHVRATIAATDVELRNQVDYLMSRCANVDTTAASAGAPASATPATPAGSSGATPSAPPRSDAPTPASDKPRTDSAKTVAAKTMYSVQVAAFTEAKDADALVKHLKARGLAARSTPSGRYYRVRIGRYGSREAAVKVRDELRRQGTQGFVTEAEPETR